MTYRYLFFAAINGFFCVALGAFGAHALETILDASALQTWQTAVQYQMFHTFGLLAIGLIPQTKGNANYLAWSGRLFITGLFLFCGSLYLLALSGIRILGIITPVGGAAWLLAWLFLARVAMLKSAPE